MGKAKNWSPDECEGAAKAYIDSTLDEMRGAEQRSEDFAARVHKAFEYYAPPGVAGTGTWTDRDPGGNTVLNMGLSGVTYEQKVNIAVAMYLKRVKEGQTPYDLRDFDASKWRLFKAYLVLKDTGKLAEPTASTRPSDEVRTQVENSSESDANEGFITDSSTLKPRAGKGGKNFVGRDQAKKNEQREDYMKRKTIALEAFAGTEAKKLKVMEDIKTQVHTQNIIAMLGHPSVVGNHAVSDKLTKSVLKSLGLLEKKKKPANARTADMEENVPGDLLCVDVDDDEEEDDDLSHDSSSMNRPLGGEALDNHVATKQRAAAAMHDTRGASYFEPSRDLNEEEAEAVRAGAQGFPV